ncbi:MAG TPA: transcriptional regulator [Chloroflexi bacterium]|nr:transcriptional regulator [Chloroflexota bacterium]
MNKYGQYCPTARAVEILGDRWTLLIVRDLLLGAQHFNELERGLPGIPKALLAQRLRRLQQVGVIERYGDSKERKTCYQLTPAGQELFPVIESLTRWGAKWAFREPEPAELDPVLLLWWMRNRVNRERLPLQRIVVEFNFREARSAKYWLVLSPKDVSVCLKHPGYEIDILVTTELAVLYQVWFGRIAFHDAIREQQVQLDAAPALIREFPKWFALSQAASIVRAVAAT